MRIGIVADTRDASFGPWADVEPERGLVALRRGARRAPAAAPVIFPVVEAYARRSRSSPSTLVDGLLLTGGRDLDAGSYGAEPDPANDRSDPLRDRVELALGRLAVERRLPVLGGLPRACTLLNVALGGGIDQHLADPDGVHRGEPGTFTSHPVEVVAGTRLQSIIGAGEATVRSHHHQGVAPLADGLRAAAHSPDGLVEAAEIDRRRLVRRRAVAPRGGPRGRRPAPLRVPGRGRGRPSASEVAA